MALRKMWSPLRFSHLSRRLQTGSLATLLPDMQPTGCAHLSLLARWSSARSLSGARASKVQLPVLLGGVIGNPDAVSITQTIIVSFRFMQSLPGVVMIQTFFSHQLM